MSKLRTAKGDDHPDAARKHLVDAKVLLAQNRPDGAGYLSGYVVECALKSLWLYEVDVPIGRMPWGKQKAHELSFLANQVSALATVAGARTARYYKTATGNVPTSVIAAWNPAMRYQSPTTSASAAVAWCKIAEDVFNESVGQMMLDGVL